MTKNKHFGYKPDRYVRGKPVYRFSNSSFNTHFACARKFHLQYVQHVYTRRKSPALDMGSGFHKGVEAGYRNENIKRAVGRYYKDVIEIAPDNRTQQEAMIDRAKAYAMANGYIQRYLRKDRRRFKKISIEKSFEFILVETDDFILTYSGDIDGVFEDDEGLWICEHKTTSDPSDAYRARLPFNGQVLGYAVACKKFTGRWPVGCIYNMVKKTAIRLKVAESLPTFLRRVANEYIEFAEKKQYFIRDEFLYNGKNIREWIASAKIHALALHSMLQHQKDMALWMHNTDACLDYRACPMLNICKTGNINDMMYQIVPNPQHLVGRKKRRLR